MSPQRKTGVLMVVRSDVSEERNELMFSCGGR